MSGDWTALVQGIQPSQHPLLVPTGVATAPWLTQLRGSSSGCDRGLFSEARLNSLLPSNDTCPQVCLQQVPLVYLLCVHSGCLLGRRSLNVHQPPC